MQHSKRRWCWLVLLLVACAPESEVAETGPPPAPIAPGWCSNLPRAQYAQLERVPLAQEVSSNWFEVYRVGDGVFAIYEPLQWQEVISYLIVGTERALLFDTGLGIAPIRPVVEALTEMPVVVMNSHSHYDHVGGNWEFEEIAGRDTEFTKERARGVEGPGLEAELAPEALCGPLPGGASAETFRSRAWEITEWIDEGTKFDLGGRTLEVLAVPGHTPDAVALLEREQGWLFTGDSFYEGPIWLFDEGTDLAAYSESVERFAALAPQLSRVFAAHNTPVAEPDVLLSLAETLEEVRAGRTADAMRDDGIEVFEAERFSLLLDPEAIAAWR